MEGIMTVAIFGVGASREGMLDCHTLLVEPGKLPGCNGADCLWPVSVITTHRAAESQSRFRATEPNGLRAFQPGDFSKYQNKVTISRQIKIAVLQQTN